MEQAKQELTARSRSSSTTGCRQTRLCLPGSSTARPVTKAGLFRLEQARQAQTPAIIESRGRGSTGGCGETRPCLTVSSPSSTPASVPPEAGETPSCAARPSTTLPGSSCRRSTSPRGGETWPCWTGSSPASTPASAPPHCPDHPPHCPDQAAGAALGRVQADQEGGYHHHASRGQGQDTASLRH